MRQSHYCKRIYKNILGVAGVHQNNFKPVLLQYLESWNPIDTRRFHRNTGDTTRLEPFSQVMQVLRKGAKRTYWEITAVWVYGGQVNGRTNVDSGSIWIDQLQILLIGVYLLHGRNSSVYHWRGGAMQVLHLPNRDHRENGVAALTSASEAGSNKKSEGIQS